MYFYQIHSLSLFPLYDFNKLINATSFSAGTIASPPKRRRVRFSNPVEEYRLPIIPNQEFPLDKDVTDTEEGEEDQLIDDRVDTMSVFTRSTTGVNCTLIDRWGEAIRATEFAIDDKIADLQSLDSLLRIVNTKHSIGKAPRQCWLDGIVKENVSAVDYAIRLMCVMMSSAVTSDTQLRQQLYNRINGSPFTLDELADMNEFNPIILNGIMSSLGLHNKNSEFIVKCAKKIKDQFGSQFPQTYREMISLPGIGSKIACVLMYTLYGRIEVSVMNELFIVAKTSSHPALCYFNLIDNNHRVLLLTDMS